MTEHDWARTEVGPVAVWPASLHFAVRTVLAPGSPWRSPGARGTAVLQRRVRAADRRQAPGRRDGHPGHPRRGLGGPAGPDRAREASWLPRLPLLLERAGSPADIQATVDVSGPVRRGHWRLAATDRAPAALRGPLRRFLDTAGLDPDQSYDLLLAACEAVTNAVEHAQHPTEPVVDVQAVVDDDVVELTVRDTGQWRERVPSMDRGRGSTLMAAVAEVTVRPGPLGTTVVVRADRLR